MKIKRHAAQGLADVLVSKLSVTLGQVPSVINTPPSQKSQYPAMAILIDRAQVIISNDDEDVQVNSTKTPDDAGYELTGNFRTDPVTNDYVTGTTHMVDQDTTISQIGTIRMKGRLWVGARLDAQREQMEQDVSLAFYESREAPGRLMISVAGIEIRGVKIPFGVATAILEDEMQWNSEFAFAERLWTFMPFSYDIPLMVPRTDPLASQLILMVSEDIVTIVDDPTGLTNLVDLQQFTVDSDGVVTQI